MRTHYLIINSEDMHYNNFEYFNHSDYVNIVRMNIVINTSQVSSILLF